MEQLAVLFSPSLDVDKAVFFVRAFGEALNRHHCAPLEIFLKGKVLIKCFEALFAGIKCQYNADLMPLFSASRLLGFVYQMLFRICFT